MSAPFVAARGVTKRWTPDAGLWPTDLDVAAGEMVVVRGRSGTGKSTLLALLAGWCRPDAGSVTIGGSAPGPDEPWARIALVPQALCLAGELSVAENVADATGGALGPRSAEVADLLVALDLAVLARRTLGEVSSGQLQRLAVARALIATPRVLLADEPTSFQDLAHASVVVAALRDAAGRGSAVVVATHDPLVAGAADRIVDLTAGR